MKIGLIGGLALAALLPGAAMAFDGEALLGFTAEDIARGKVEASADRASSAAVIQAVSNGSVEMMGFRYRGDSAVMVADRLIVLPTGRLIIDGGALSSLEGGKGISSYAHAEFSSAELFERVMTGDSCAPFVDGGKGSEPLGEAEFTDVTLETPPSAAEMADFAVGQKGPENIHFKVMNVSFEGIDALDCFMVDRFDASGVTALSADGTRGMVETISGRANLLPQAGEPYVIEASAHGVVTRDASGAELMGTETTTFSLSIDDRIISGVRRLPELSDETVIPEIAKLLARGNFGLSYRTEGLYFPLGELLSETQRARLGATGDEIIRGDQETSISSSGERVSILNDTRFEGLVDAHVDLDLVITPDASGGRALAMTGGHPAGLILPYLQLEGLEFSVDDKGLWDLIEGGTGSSPEGHLSSLTPMLRQGPSEIAGPVISWMEGIARDGHGGVTMNPLEPVSFMDIMMGAMMNPGGLGRMLSVEAE